MKLRLSLHERHQGALSSVLQCILLFGHLQSTVHAQSETAKVDFVSPVQRSGQDVFDVARESTGCVWLDSFDNGKVYSWRIQPKFFADASHQEVPCLCLSLNRSYHAAILCRFLFHPYVELCYMQFTPSNTDLHSTCSLHVPTQLVVRIASITGGDTVNGIGGLSENCIYIAARIFP